jgi:hypothetical protein
MWATRLRCLAKRAFQKIILQRQLSNLRMERFQIHSWSHGAGLGLGPKYSGSPLQKLCFPLRDLVDVHVELLRQLDQRLLALQGSQRHLCLECRAVVPAYSFRHRLS